MLAEWLRLRARASAGPEGRAYRFGAESTVANSAIRECSRCVRCQRRRHGSLPYRERGPRCAGCGRRDVGASAAGAGCAASSRRCILCKLAAHRSPSRSTLAKSRRGGRPASVTLLPYVIDQLSTTQLSRASGRGEPLRLCGPLHLSPGRNIGPHDPDGATCASRRRCPSNCWMSRRRSATACTPLIAWAQMGEGSDYTDNLPDQCLHPVGHRYEVPNMPRMGAALVGRPRTCNT